MSKLSKKQKEQLDQIGLTCKTVEDAQKQVAELLAKEGLDGMDEDPLDELLEIAVEVVPATTTPDEDDDEEDEDEESANDEEEEYDEAADEDEDEDEDEDDEINIDDMDRTELKALIKSEKMGIKVAKKWSDDDIRDAIRSEFLDEEDEEEAPVAKPKKPAAKPTGKKDKPAAKPTGKKDAFSKENADHVVMITDSFGEAFPDLEFKILKRGFTAYLPLKSAKRAVFNFDYLTLKDDTMQGNLFLNAIKGLDEANEMVTAEGFEIKGYNRSLTYIPKLTIEEAIEILTTDDLVDEMKKKLGHQDKKAVANRKKMEEAMATKTKADKKADKKKKTAAVEEEVEVEVEAPKKKKKKVAPAEAPTPAERISSKKKTTTKKEKKK